MSGILYSTYDGDENLTHDTQVDAVEAHFESICINDDGFKPGSGDAEFIALIMANTPVTVYAYKRMTVDARSRERVCHAMVERFIELYDDDFGAPDEQTAEPAGWSNKLRALVYEFCDATTVWRCEKCGEETFTADQVIEMLGLGGTP